MAGLVQIARRSIQISVILLVTAIAFLSLYAHYRAARVIEDPQLMAGLRGEVAAQLIHPWIQKLEDPQAFLDSNKGTVWSMRLLGFSLTDPLAVAEKIAASKSIHLWFILSALLPLLITLLLGKVFCSWICPGYVLFELGGKLRGLLQLAEIRPAEVRFSFANKYLFLLAGLVLAALFSLPLFAMIYPPAVVSRTIHAWIFGTELTGMLVLLGAMVAFEALVSPRWWCRTLCPGGALYGLLGWARPVRVRLTRAECTGCMECIPVCEAGLNPITQSSSIECDNCGVCIRHCRPAALRFSIGLPSAASRALARRKNEKILSSKGLIQGIVLLLSFLAPAHLSAHHILGLPHYSYKENYPQRPTLEYPAATGPYDVLFTSFPGIPKPGEPAFLAFYVKNRETSAVYQQPVSLRVLQTSTFGDNNLILPPTRREPMENQHKFQCTFPADGEYIVELTLEVEGKTEVIPFLMVAGEPSAATSYFIAAAAAALVLFIAIRAIHKKRQRKWAQARQGAAPAAVSEGRETPPPEPSHIAKNEV